LCEPGPTKHQKKVAKINGCGIIAREIAGKAVFLALDYMLNAQADSYRAVDLSE